jgi:hypothetical protein
MRPYGSKTNKKHPCACCLSREKYAKMHVKKRERKRVKEEIKNELQRSDCGGKKKVC